MNTYKYVLPGYCNQISCIHLHSRLRKIKDGTGNNAKNIFCQSTEELTLYAYKVD